jgi:DNA mismatch repair protein MutL
MKGQHPVTFLFLEMDAHGYDVNVHPAKKEVRFHDGHGVREAVASAVSAALAATRSLPTGHPTGSARTQPFAETPQVAPTTTAKPQSFHLQPEPPPPAVVPAQTLLPIPATFSAPTRSFVPPEPPSPKAPQHLAAASAPPVPSVSSSTSRAATANDSSPTEDFTRFRILGVLHRLYVLLESPEGLVLMDQHAAHERVMFEQMRRAMEHEGVPTQRLLMPITLQLSPRDADLISRNLDSLSRLGIETEPFGPNTFKVETLPTFLKTDDPMDWLDQVIEELRGMSGTASSLRLGEDMIATTVCRHAVKANDHLSLPELQALLKDLAACEMPYCCPHGRPTLIQISHSELERKFGRRAPG